MHATVYLAVIISLIGAIAVNWLTAKFISKNIVHMYGGAIAVAIAVAFMAGGGWATFLFTIPAALSGHYVYIRLTGENNKK